MFRVRIAAFFVTFEMLILAHPLHSALTEAQTHKLDAIETLLARLDNEIQDIRSREDDSNGTETNEVHQHKYAGVPAADKSVSIINIQVQKPSAAEVVSKKHKEHEDKKSDDKTKAGSHDLNATHSDNNNVVGDYSDDSDQLDKREKLERQMRDLLDKIKQAFSCAVQNGECGFANGAKTCCKGLKCSSGWKGTCQADCVAAGDVCEHNWFCCGQRQCAKTTTYNSIDVYRCV